MSNEYIFMFYIISVDIWNMNTYKFYFYTNVGIVLFSFRDMY